MIKTIVFDIGNVVWNFKPLFTQLKTSWAKSLNLSPKRLISLYDQPGVYQFFETDRLTLKQWFKSINSTISPSSLINEINRIFSDTAVFESHLNNDIVNLIKTLRQKPDLTLGSLSNVENFFSPIWHQHFDQYFDFAIVSSDVKIRKPQPEIYQLIFQHVKNLPSETVFIDDKAENIDAARKLGIHGIIFQNYRQLISDLSAISPVLMAYTS